MSRSSPPKAASKVPVLQLHKGTGQGLVKLDGHFFYLGPYGEPQTQQKYHQKIAEWIANGRRLPVEKNQITVVEILDRFLDHAKQYYCSPEGADTGELRNQKSVIRVVRELYGTSKACEFGPLALDAVRTQLVASGKSRNVINGYIGRIKHIFKWAVSRQLITADVA